MYKISKSLITSSSFVTSLKGAPAFVKFSLIYSGTRNSGGEIRTNDIFSYLKSAFISE